ncbi:hypothetical protein HMPREF0880_00135 [Yokenella regensburgei ATCC 43003]|nr:hypothetical protein HMPREF0880_00135 [Yokenella regensburgei ATCC 43003]
MTAIYLFLCRLQRFPALWHHRLPPKIMTTSAIIYTRNSGIMFQLLSKPILFTLTAMKG